MFWWRMKNVLQTVSVWLIAVIIGASINLAVADVRDKSAASQAKEAYKTVEWIDLIPDEDLNALLNPPEYLNEIPDGSAEDLINGELQSTQPQPNDSRYEQALSSKNIKPEFNNQRIRIPGFIVPLEFNEEQVVTTFFLVPFFGACIHVPPPPPNQIIYAEFEPGKKLDVLYDAFWIEGVINTTLTENDMATSAYAITVTSIKPYSE